MIYGHKFSIVREGLELQKDVYYNKDKFDSGEINICFITGLSGSGKTTLSKKLSGDNIEHYELDDVLYNYAFTDNQLKEYGDLIYSYFKGIGSKYRFREKVEFLDNKIEDSLIKGFVKYAIDYTKSHKDRKFIIEGVELFWKFRAEHFKNYAVIIKGTSANMSRLRASIRDSSDANNGIERVGAVLKTMSDKDRAKAYNMSYKIILEWKKYFTNLKNS